MAGPSVEPAAQAATTFGNEDNGLFSDGTNFSILPSSNHNPNSPMDVQMPFNDPLGWGQEDEDGLNIVGSIKPPDDYNSLELVDNKELCEEFHGELDVLGIGDFQMDEDEQC